MKELCEITSCRYYQVKTTYTSRSYLATFSFTPKASSCHGSSPSTKYRSRLGRGIAQAVSRRLLNAGAPVRAHGSPCGIFGVQRGTGTCSSQEFFSVPLSIGYHCPDAPYSLIYHSDGCTMWPLAAAVP
jgi:hypothetical protein